MKHNLPGELYELQLEAVNTIDKLLLIIAGAGSEKTRVGAWEQARI